MRAKCEMSFDLEFMVPTPEQHQWDCPEGYICLYEMTFEHCRLWLSLPYHFVKYADNYKVAFTQMTIVGIFNLVGLMVLGAETGVKVSVEMFEQISSLNNGSKPGHFYTSMRASCKLISDFKSKVNRWSERYFFIKIDISSVSDVAGR